MRSKISAGVRGIGARLERKDSSLSDAGNDTGRRTVADMLSERVQEIRRTLLDEPRVQPGLPVRALHAMYALLLCSSVSIAELPCLPCCNALKYVPSGHGLFPDGAVCILQPCPQDPQLFRN